VGLHWLMVSPKGLHVSGPDASLRQRSGSTSGHLIDLCADPGGSGVSCLRFAQQRSTTGGSRARKPPATSSTAGRGGAARRPSPGGVLVEACRQSIRRGADPRGSRRRGREIGNPYIRTLFDVHNAVDEACPHAALVERYFDDIRHVHVNDWTGPTMGPETTTLSRCWRSAAPQLRGVGLAGGFRLTPAPNGWPANRAPLESEIASYQYEPLRCHGGAGFIGSAIVRALLREAPAGGLSSTTF